MKIKMLVLGMALSMVVAATANAGTTWLGLNGGMGMPTGDYGDAASNGWNVGVNASQSLNDMWGIGADLGFHRWGASDDLKAATILAFGPGSEINFSAIQATGNVQLNMPTQGMAKPYAKAGLGLYSVKSKLTSPSGDDDVTKSKFGYNFGAGMNFATHSNMQWGVGAAYHIIPTKNDFGFDSNFASVGLNLRWGVSH
jgi:opacity protein-like surface antigen